MLCTIADFKRINKILSHGKVYPYIVDDYSAQEPPEDFGLQFLKEPLIKVLMPNEHCVFILTPLLNTVYIVHSNVLPEGRGKTAIKAGRRAARWMFNNTKCVSLISFTPADNKVALMFSSLVGFKRIGIIEKSFKKGNIYYDQIITGLLKGEI